MSRFLVPQTKLTHIYCQFEKVITPNAKRKQELGICLLNEQFILYSMLTTLAGKRH